MASDPKRATCSYSQRGFSADFKNSPACCGLNLFNGLRIAEIQCDRPLRVRSNGRLTDNFTSLAAVLQYSKCLSHRVDAGGRGCPNGTRSPSLPVDSDLAPGTASGMSDGMI